MTRTLAGAAYWAFAACVTAFGMVGIFSIGAPILLIGLTLLVVGPWRHSKTVFWPAITAVLCFIVGYVLVSPLGCTTSATSFIETESGKKLVSKGHTVCDNLLGIDYSGAGTYNPSPIPALIAGGALATTGLGAMSLLVRRTNPNAR